MQSCNRLQLGVKNNIESSNATLASLIAGSSDSTTRPMSSSTSFGRCHIDICFTALLLNMSFIVSTSKTVHYKLNPEGVVHTIVGREGWARSWQCWVVSQRPRCKGVSARGEVEKHLILPIWRLISDIRFLRTICTGFYGRTTLRHYEKKSHSRVLLPSKRRLGC